MTTVKMVKLGTLIKPAKLQKCGNDDYPVLSMTMHNGLVFQSDKFKKSVASQDKSTYKVVHRNQLVIGFPIDEGVLATQRITDAGIVSPAYGIWDVDQTKIIPEFLEYALRCNRAIDYYKAKLRGSTARRRSLPTPTLLELDVPLPDIEQQKLALTTIHHAKNALDSRQAQLTKLDELVKARFVEMFGEPGAKNENWPQCTLGKACKINPKKSEDIRLQPNLEVSFVPMPAVTENGKMDSSIIKIYDEVKTGFTYFSERDVLFAKITPCMENGKGAVAVNLKNEIGFGSTEFHVIRPIAEKTNPYWIYALTVFEKFRKDAAKNMTGSAGQRRVPASFLENYQISLPPIDLQNQFAAFVAEVDKSKLFAELFAQNACILAENRSK